MLMSLFGQLLTGCSSDQTQEDGVRQLDAPVFRLLSSTGESTAQTLQLGEANELAGYDGCAAYTGSYHRNGESIYVTALQMDKSGCKDSTAATEQQAFLDALQYAISINMEGERLIITSERTSVPLRFESAASTK